MRQSLAEFVAALPRLARDAETARALLSDEAAAHAYLAAATKSRPGEAPRYAALVPRRVRILAADEARPVAGAEFDSSAVAQLLRHRLDSFGTTVELADGTRIPVPTREAVVAQLLARGGLALGLVASMLRVQPDAALDTDEVRDLLKAARLSERYQPLLELLDVA